MRPRGKARSCSRLSRRPCDAQVGEACPFLGRCGVYSERESNRSEFKWEFSRPACTQNEDESNDLTKPLGKERSNQRRGKSNSKNGSLTSFDHDHTTQPSCQASPSIFSLTTKTFPPSHRPRGPPRNTPRQTPGCKTAEHTSNHSDNPGPRSKQNLSASYPPNSRSLINLGPCPTCVIQASPKA